MEPKICSIIFLIMLGIAKCEEEDSEELKRTSDAVYIIPDVLVFTNSVNDALMVTCNGTDINWKSPNNTFVDSKKGRVHVEDDSELGSHTQSLRLIFETIYEIDNGKWTCMGIYDEKFFHLFVYVPIEFQPTDISVDVIEHENVTLKCIANGNPQPTIHWNFKGNRISSLEEEFASHYSNMTDGLFIKNVRRQHSGEYTCKAIQMISKRVTDMKELAIQLNVQYKPEIILNSSRTSLNGKFDAENFEYIKYAALNGTVTLVCEADGNPFPTFLWYHDGKKMSHHLVKSTELYSELTVHFHSNKSFGEYKCIARNIIGQVKMYVRVIEGKRPDTPKEIKLEGSGKKILDINIGSKKPDMNDPLAITHYRFEIMFKEDWEKSNEWKNQFIKDKKAESNVTYTLIDLKPNTTYLVRVAAINAVGISNFTGMKQFTTLAEDPQKSNAIDCNISNIFLYLVATVTLSVAHQLKMATY